MRVRILEHDGIYAYPLEGTLSWSIAQIDESPRIFRLREWPEGEGYYSTRVLRFETLGPDVLPETGTPETGAAFDWPTQDLRVLCSQFPAAPYTRMLLRLTFGEPPPDDATTYERLVEWARVRKAQSQTAAPVQGPVPTAPPTGVRRMSTAERREAEIRRGEYVEVEATLSGTETVSRPYTHSATVRVPFSILRERDEDVFRSFVEDYLRDRTEKEYDIYGEEIRDDDWDIPDIDADFDELVAENVESEDEDEDEE